MTLLDLLLRYKQTVMGFGWAIFMPLVNTAIFSVIFMRVARFNRRAVIPLYVQRLVGVELLRRLAAVRRHLAYSQLESGEQGLLPA